MTKNDINKPMTAEEAQLDSHSATLINLLTKKGVLEDQSIDDERIRQAQKEKKRNMYHNTYLLLRNYRDISWALECFPSDIAAELEQPFGNLDALLGKVDTELGMENRKLESRLDSVRRSRLLMDRVNEALTVLKRKPEDGPKMYELIYLTFIAPEVLTQTDLLYRLNISSRHYYRLRKQAINILAIRLWTVPDSSVDAWLEVLTLLESL